MKKLKSGLVGALVTLMSIGMLQTNVVASETQHEAKKQTVTEGLKQLQSYEELVDLFKAKGYLYEEDVYDKGDVDIEKFITEDYMTQDIVSSETSGSNNFSQTNIQVTGVDEADIIKVDERYIYSCVSEENIAIIDTNADNKGKMQQVASINYNDGESHYTVEDMFLDEKHLTVVMTHYERIKYERNDRIRRRNKSYTIVKVYDITSRNTPKLTRTMKVEGDFSTIRKIENQIYLITSRDNYYLESSNYTKEDILPTYMDSTASNQLQTIDVKNIMYNASLRCSAYTVITSFNIDNTKAASFDVLLSRPSEIYMDKDSIYLTVGDSNWKNEQTSEGVYQTFITKYSVENAQVEYESFAKVPGEVLNQFSMDEYKDYFRIATTNEIGGTTVNSAYVLDKTLNVVGKLENLAPGERIYSVRFEGEKGYVVTFEQIDPLFVIDLKSPTAPKVLGELKVPGFSQYLHPIGDNLVVGIGRSTVENIIRDETGKEIVTGVSAQAIKLSLFDVTSPKKPKEINHIILGTGPSWSEALENHKAVMVDKDRHLLAIPVMLEFNKPVKITDKRSAMNFQGAYVFAVENGKLVGKAKLGQIDAATGEYAPNYRYDNGRVCYIGDKMYYLYSNQINAYDMDTFKCNQTIILK